MGRVEALPKISLRSQPVSDIILWYPVEAPVQTSAQHPEWQRQRDAGKKASRGRMKDRRGGEWKDGDYNPDLLAFLSLTVLSSCSTYGERICLYFVSVLFLSLGLTEKKAVDAMEK